MGFLPTLTVGLAVAVLGLGFERMWKYFSKRHDIVLKSEYDIKNLFGDYTELKNAVDDNIEKQNENTMITKELAMKIDNMILNTHENNKIHQKILNFVYLHDSQIKYIASQLKVDMSMFNNVKSIFKEDYELEEENN